jgi:hypothetical protein
MEGGERLNASIVMATNSTESLNTLSRCTVTSLVNMT